VSKHTQNVDLRKKGERNKRDILSREGRWRWWVDECKKERLDHFGNFLEREKNVWKE